jgi:hypothetical protein
MRRASHAVSLMESAGKLPCAMDQARRLIARQLARSSHAHPGVPAVRLAAVPRWCHVHGEGVNARILFAPSRASASSLADRYLSISARSHGLAHSPLRSQKRYANA